jgi:hypothetical protein
MRRTYLVWLAYLGLVSPALADGFTVRTESLPVPLTRHEAAGDAVDTKIEASAVEPVGDGSSFLLIAHDKDQGLIVVTPEGRIIDPPITCSAFPKGLKAGPKWEGMARDEKGNYYVIGAHSGTTAAERDERAYLLRFRLKEGDSNTPPAIDDTSVVRWQVKEPLGQAMAAEGLSPEAMKIEGLATRSRDGKTELFVGLREPTDLVRVYVADISTPPANDAPLSFHRLFAFQPGTSEGVQRTLTSLHYVPSWHGFLIVTASEDEDNAFHGNTLWFLADDRIEADGRSRPEVAWNFEVAMKAEGLCELPSPDGKTLRLVVTYDNDPHATHIPSRMQIIRLSR